MAEWHMRKPRTCGEVWSIRITMYASKDSDILVAHICRDSVVSGELNEA